MFVYTTKAFGVKVKQNYCMLKKIMTDKLTTRRGLIAGPKFCQINEHGMFITFLLHSVHRGLVPLPKTGIFHPTLKPPTLCVENVCSPSRGVSLDWWNFLREGIFLIGESYWLGKRDWQTLFAGQSKVLKWEKGHIILYILIPQTFLKELYFKSFLGH